MLQVYNRFLIAVSLIVILLLIRLLILPSISGIESSQQIELKYDQLYHHQQKRITAMNLFKHHEKKWGARIDLSQSVLLPFLLEAIEGSVIKLVDFTEEDPLKQDLDNATKRYFIQVEGPTQPTLMLLNALEQEFPFATIQNLVITKKTVKRKSVLMTQFYFEQ